ncbi:MAG TPA: heavy metal-binding domain-containing protein [Sphingobacteriaceae bacterium]|nr:heavy metal-binding domain-containing protein [Sphingobacteriaceae bacterium]
MKHAIVLLLVFIGLNTFAQNNGTKVVPNQKDSIGQSFTCPMHAEVLSDNPGKCPKCVMNLVEKKGAAKEKHACPMHPEITSSKGGKCSKCGMELKEIKANKTKGNKESKETAMYKCPMHTNISAKEPGACPKCGMALVKED